MLQKFGIMYDNILLNYNEESLYEYEEGHMYKLYATESQLCDYEIDLIKYAGGLYGEKDRTPRPRRRRYEDILQEIDLSGPEWND